MCRTLHWALLNFTRFPWAYFSSQSRSLWMASLPSKHINCTTQLGVIHKLAEGALNPTVSVINQDIEKYWSQYGPLRDPPSLSALLVTSNLTSASLSLESPLFSFFQKCLFSFAGWIWTTKGSHCLCHKPYSLHFPLGVLTHSFPLSNVEVSSHFCDAPCFSSALKVAI